jgi:hypothetical protein
MTLNRYLTTVGNTTPHPHLSNRRTDNGPTELADVVVHLLRGAPSSGLEPGGWLSELELRRLIRVAFFASLDPEEGRYPRCSLFWSIYPHEWFDTCEFRPEKPLDAETLRRLAPICQSNGSAIRVSLQGEELRLAGMTATRFQGLDFFAGRPGFVSRGREINVQVHIVAPGHIRVDCGCVEYELRAGRLRECPSLRSLKCVRDLSDAFGVSVEEEVASRLKLTNEQCRMFGGLRHCLDAETLLQMILRPILAHGHGGAVVLIPSRDVPWLSDDLESSNGVAALSLTEYSVQHLVACVECHEPNDLSDAFSPQRIDRSLQTRGRLAMAARTIGELASVDGCVVLDQSLSVINFGTKINCSREQAEESPIKYVNAGTNAVLELHELEKQGGTRLRTALWLCKARPNVIVFVVSQDQNLKVLWSDDKSAFAFGPLDLSTSTAFV